MKIYILEVENTWDNPTFVFVGAFSSQDKVDEFIAEHKYEIIPRGDGTKYSHEVEYEVSEYELDDVNVSINTGSSGFKTEFSPCKIEDETDKEKSGGIALCLSGRQERIAIRVLERIEAERNEGKSQS